MSESVFVDEPSGTLPGPSHTLGLNHGDVYLDGVKLAAGRGIIALSSATCEVLAQIVLGQPVGQALLSAVRGEHGIAPEVEMVLRLSAILLPKAMLEPKQAPNRAARRRANREEAVKA